MGKPLDWRKIEADIIEIAKLFGFSILEDSKSGDRYIDIETIKQDINLTEVAKELAKRLGGKS